MIIIQNSLAGQAKFKIQNCKSIQGFTLMELVVASALFMIVVFIATGSFVQALRNQRDARDLTSANSNLSQTLEAIAREVRTGSDFSQTTNEELNFINYKSERVSYKLLENGTIGKCEHPVSCVAGTYIPMTSEKYAISAFNFYHQGIQESDGEPPRITISATIEGIRDQSTTMQTTVSSKNIGT